MRVYCMSWPLPSPTRILTLTLTSSLSMTLSWKIYPETTMTHSVEAAASEFDVAADVHAHDVRLVELNHHLARLLVHVALLVLHVGCDREQVKMRHCNAGAHLALQQCVRNYEGTRSDWCLPASRPLPDGA